MIAITEAISYIIVAAVAFIIGRDSFNNSKKTNNNEQF
jgi:hypothetical protein